MSRPTVNDIFETLDQLRAFCVEFGYKYNEKDLNQPRSYVWRQFDKYRNGKRPNDQWLQDAKKFGIKL